MVFDMYTQQRVEKALQTHPRIKQVITIEPKVHEILSLAASQTCKSERWQMYEILKYVSSRYVGWYAEQAALRSEAHYNVIMDALDLLLPSPEVEYETIQDADREAVLQQLRDAVKQSFPQIALPDQNCC